MQLVFFAMVITVIFKAASTDNAYFNCAEIGTQRHVSIDQLMGLWYGIELISHRQEASYEPQHPDTCLQINISEEPNPFEGTTRNYNRQNYDTRNRYDNYDTITSTQIPYETRRNQERHRKKWGQRGMSDRNGVYMTEVEQRRLKVLWIGTDGSIVTYWTSYMSAPGVWHITGPHNGSSLIETLDNFSGTIQVLKAVGDHLVLSFCHIRPDQKLYTVILSRLPELKRRDIVSIHNMLTTRGLDIANVRNVCPVSGASNFNFNVVLLFTCYAILFLW